MNEDLRVIEAIGRAFDIVQITNHNVNCVGVAHNIFDHVSAAVVRYTRRTGGAMTLWGASVTKDESLQDSTIVVVGCEPEKAGMGIYPSSVTITWNDANGS